MGTSSGKQGSKRDRERLRHEMLGRGCGTAEVAREMAGRWGFNARQSWRFAHGLSQEEAAARYNALLDDRAMMTGKRVSDYEGWPLRGARPTLHALTVFAQVYGTSPRALLGEAELPLMPVTDRMLLDRLATAGAPSGTGTGTATGTGTGSGTGPDPHPAAGGERGRAPGAGPRHGPEHGDEATPGSGAGDSRRGPDGGAPGGGSWTGGAPDGDGERSGPLTPAVVRAAARVSSDHAAGVETSEVGPLTLEQLEHDGLELARAYIGAPADALFPALALHRDRVYRLLARRSHPAQQSELYLLAGQACGLLASASMELGCLTAASAQARAAWTYAGVIGHNGLRAWARGTQALIAFWAGNPRETVRLAESGRDYVRAGTGFVRLCNIESRGWARLGDRAQTVRVIGLGHRARARASAVDTLHDVVGGEFGFDEARQAFCNAGAFVQLDDPDRALRAAGRALSLYASDAERDRTYGGEGSTRLEMAQAYLRKRNLDAADDICAPVLAGAANVGGGHLPLRLAELQETLVSAPYRRCREAVELSERIGEFRTRRAGG